MALTKREEVYDEHIAPLMRSIIVLCEEHDIPVIASFQLNDERPGCTDRDADGEEMGPFYCTTRMHGSDVGDNFVQAGRALAPDPAPR